MTLKLCLTFSSLPDHKHTEGLSKIAVDYMCGVCGNEVQLELGKEVSGLDWTLVAIKQAQNISSFAQTV